MSDSVSVSMRPNTLHLPPGSWETVFDCLCERFPAVGAECWHHRFSSGKVLDGGGRPLTLEHPYQVGMKVHYFREVENEPVIPFEEKVLYADEHLVVADKPHFLPVQPAGRYVGQTLLARLVRRLGNPDLVPLHRIDRLTAGLVLFSACPDSRNVYQKLFREQRMDKYYQAIAPALPERQFPLLHRSRLIPGEPFFRMREAPGEANTETRIEVLERSDEYWRYALYPLTGKKHQLRVHMASLGAGILHDRFYPRLLDGPDQPDDYLRPLQLLAAGLEFIDPLSHERRRFRTTSRLALDLPERLA